MQKMVFDAGDKGDEVALDIIDKYIKYVAIGIVNLVNIFEPQSVIIGGGVCAQGVKLTRPIHDTDEKYPEKFQNNRSLQYRELVHKRVSADGISEPSAEWRGADLAD